MNKSIDMDLVKKSLQDADLFEENMSEEDMIGYYKALKNSEDTATEENESRRLTVQNEELAEIIDVSLSSTNVAECNNNKNDSGNAKNALQLSNPLTNINKISIQFNDLFECDEKVLGIIHHKVKGNLPPLKDPKYKNESIEVRASQLISYHAHLNKLHSLIAKRSLLPAPLPKFINLSITSSESEEEKANQGNSNDTYTSRSGRQTKRKLYTDTLYEEDLENFDFTKPTVVPEDDDDDNDGEWFALSSPAKKTKTDSVENQKSLHSDKKKVKLSKLHQLSTEKSAANGENKESKTSEVDLDILNAKPTSVSHKAPNKESALSSDVEIQERKAQSKWILKDTVVQSSPRANRGRPKLNSKINNKEIMQRSSLFSDSPRRMSRQEYLFDKLKKGEETKKKEEKAMERFGKTLQVLDDEERETENQDSDIINVEVEETTFVPRRIIPPVPGRRPINSRKRAGNTDSGPRSQLDISVGPSSNTSQSRKKRDETIKEPKTKPTSQKQNVETSSTLEVATSRVQCPICGNEFPEKEIENHASACGDISMATRSTKMPKITCEVCDSVVPLDTDYEVHVRNCIASQKK